MVDSWKECVCDLTHIMRFRLLCGLYNQRAVLPRWRGFAQVYCVTLAIVYLIFIYLTHEKWPLLSVLRWTSLLGQYFIAVVVSLWSRDEYIYTFFSRNNITDVTLDSSMVFNRFQKQLKTAHVIALVLYAGNYLIGSVMLYKYGFMFFITSYIPSMILDIIVAQVCTTKLLVMGLFNSRVLLLRRRLERCGFRTIGSAPAQPYCQIYDEIWQGLDAVSHTFKVLLILDVIFNCLDIIGVFVYYLIILQTQEYRGVQLILQVVTNATGLFLRLTFAFGHVVLLESAAAHCEAMAVFTVTQLIKTPSAAERQRMYQLLRALEQRGARYRVLRALPLDAQLVLRVLGFCSAQALVVLNIFNAI